MFVPVNEECAEDSELPGKGSGDVVELSMASTLTLHDTDVVEQFASGICIIIIGFIEDVSKFNSRPEWWLVELVGPD